MKHGEALHLFCEEDGQALCWVCAQSGKHRDHTKVPMEEAAKIYQVRPQRRGTLGIKNLAPGECPVSRNGG